MITDPPSAGATQLTTTLVLEIEVAGASGVMGAVGSSAPFPEVDAADIPTEFMAYTLALTLAPFARLKGAACKTEMGTVQLTAVPVQPAYVEYVSPSLCRIATVYPVIAEPPSAGAAQVIVTSVVPEIAVTGAAGVLGA